MKCLHCQREITPECDNGFWLRIQQCPKCGKFLWDKPYQPPEPLDPLVVAWRQVWFYVGFAIEMHQRWLANPWLTKPLCICHPDIYVGNLYIKD